MSNNSGTAVSHTVGKVLSDAGHLLGEIGITIGGVIPSDAPGHDIMPAELSPDECVLVPETVRVLGGTAINSLFDAGSASDNISVVSLPTCQVSRSKPRRPVPVCGPSIRTGLGHPNTSMWL